MIKIFAMHYNLHTGAQKLGMKIEMQKLQNMRLRLIDT